MNQTIHIEGMSCQHCVKAVEGALTALPGVSSVTVSLEKNQAEVAFDPNLTNYEAMKEAIEDQGYDVK